MKECPGCGAALLDAAVVCGECGSRWDDGVFVASASVDAPGSGRPLGGPAPHDSRGYEWVGGLAYVDAAGGPSFLPLIALWFVVGCAVALWHAVRATVKED